MSALLPRNEEDESPDEGGTDCSFTTDAQYEVATSGSAAECYGSAVPDNEHLRWQLPRVDLHGLHIRF